MQFVKLFLPYLIIFCIFNFATPHGVNPASASDKGLLAFNYLNHLNQHIFNGPWRSTSNSKPFARFEEDSGFFITGVDKGCHILSNGVALDLTVYDGRYIDGGSMKVSICSPLSSSFSSSFLFDPTNASLIGSRMTLSVFGEDMSKSCLSEVSISFIDTSSNLPLKDLKFEDDRIEDMGIQLVISSSECSFSFATDILTSSYAYDSHKTLIFALLYAACLLYGPLQIIIFLVLKKKDTFNSPQISIASLTWRLAWAIYFFFYFLIGFPKLPQFLIVSFLAALLEICILIWLIPERKYQDDTPFIISIILLPCLLIVWSIAAHFDTEWVFITASLYLVPQIIQIYQSGERRKFSIIHSFLFVPSFLFPIISLWMNPDNFARLTPRPAFVCAFIGLIAIQMIILILQGREGKPVYHTQTNEMRRVENGSQAYSPEL